MSVIISFLSISPPSVLSSRLRVSFPSPWFSWCLDGGTPQRVLGEQPRGLEKRGEAWRIPMMLENKAGDWISRQMHSVLGFNQTLKFNI